MKSGIRVRRVDISVLLEIKIKLLVMAKAVALATVFESINSGLNPKKRIHLGLFRIISLIEFLLDATAISLKLKGAICHFLYR